MLVVFSLFSLLLTSAVYVSSLAVRPELQLVSIRSTQDTTLAKRQQQSDSILLNLDKTSFGPREPLFSNDNGLQLTCVDCSQKGQLRLQLHHDIDAAAINGFTQAAEALAASVTSEVVSAATSLASDVESIATSVAPIVTSVAGSIAASLAPVITSAAASIVNKATEIVGGGVKSALGGLGIHFRLQATAPTPDLSSLLLDIIKDVNVSVKQIKPIDAAYNLEFQSGEQAVDIPVLNLPPITPIPGVTTGSLLAPAAEDLSSSIELLPGLKLDLKLKPFVLSLAVKIAPRINTTVPVRARLNIRQPLSVSLGGVQGDIDPPELILDSPILNSIDPSLCLIASVGPQVLLSLVHAPSKTEIVFGAQIEVPKFSLCFEEDQNVDKKCQPNGPIANALHVSTSLEAGLILTDNVTLAGKDVHLPKLPSLVKQVNLTDDCFDLQKLQLEFSNKAGPQPLSLPVTSTLATSSSAAPIQVTVPLPSKASSSAVYTVTTIITTTTQSSKSDDIATRHAAGLQPPLPQASHTDIFITTIHASATSGTLAIPLPDETINIIL